MVVLAWVLSLIAVFLLGYEIQRIKHMALSLRAKVVEKFEEPPEEPDSVIVDPLDPIQQAKYEREQLMKDINPDYEE